MRPALGLAAALAASGCGAAATVAAHPSPVPPGALDEAWARRVIGRGARAVVATVVAGGPPSLTALRLHGREVEEFFTPRARARAAAAAIGITPAADDPRWRFLRVVARDGADAVVGWCARGVRVVEPDGPEGFRARELYVDRLLVVGRERDGYWGMWLEGLVWSATGWRFVPWVPYEDMVEMPRRDHADVELWDCDLGERPPVGRPAVRPAPRPPG